MAFLVEPPHNAVHGFSSAAYFFAWDCSLSTSLPLRHTVLEEAPDSEGKAEGAALPPKEEAPSAAEASLERPSSSAQDFPSRRRLQSPTTALSFFCPLQPFFLL